MCLWGNMGQKHSHCLKMKISIKNFFRISPKPVHSLHLHSVESGIVSERYEQWKKTFIHEIMVKYIRKMLEKLLKSALGSFI